MRRDAAAIATALNRTVTDRLLNRAILEQALSEAFTDEAGKSSHAVDKSGLSAVPGRPLGEGESFTLANARPEPKRGGNPKNPGQFSESPGTGQREGETPSKRDAHGTFDEAKLAAEAVQALLDNPSPEAASALIERLPALLPDDPEMAAILEEELATTFGETLTEEATVANSEHCPDCGRWLTGAGTCPDCVGAEEAAKQGINPDSTEVQAAEIGKGKAALKKCLEEQVDVYDALARSDLGTISFIYGDERRGIAHFAHREDALKHLPETLIRGKIGGEYQQGDKRNITFGGYTAVLRLQRDEKEERWVVTAFGPQDKKDGSPR